MGPLLLREGKDPLQFYIKCISRYSPVSFAWICRCARLGMGGYWVQHGRNWLYDRQRLSTNAWYQILCLLLTCRHGACLHDAMGRKRKGPVSVCLNHTIILRRHSQLRNEWFDTSSYTTVVYHDCTSSFCNFVDLEWDDSIEYDLEEIDRLVACANAGK